MPASPTISPPTISVSAIFWLTILGLVWGMFFSLSRFAGETQIPPLTIIAYSLTLEIPLFAAICIIRGKYPNLWRPASMVFYLMAAILGYMVPALLEIRTAPIIGAGLLTMIVTLTPVTTLVIAFFMRTDTLTRKKIAGVILASIAMLPILLGNNLAMPIPERAALGLTLAILVPVCYGLYHNFVARFWPSGEDGWQLASGEVIIGALTILPFVAITRGLELAPAIETGLIWIMGGYIILGAISIYLYFYLLDAGGPVFVSLAGFISLIAGVVFGIIFFGETHPWWVWGAMAVIAAAVWLATSNKTA